MKNKNIVISILHDFSIKSYHEIVINALSILKAEKPNYIICYIYPNNIMIIVKFDMFSTINVLYKDKGISLLDLPSTLFIENNRIDTLIWCKDELCHRETGYALYEHFDIFNLKILYKLHDIIYSKQNYMLLML